MKKIITALALASMLGTTSCVGPYNAFNSVASWNSRATDNKWLNELIYIGLYIVPVYQVAALGDAVIFNSLEFWTGDNPIKKPEEFKTQQAK
jgi:hypothetical protein